MEGRARAAILVERRHARTLLMGSGWLEADGRKLGPSMANIVANLDEQTSKVVTKYQREGYMYPKQT